MTSTTQVLVPLLCVFSLEIWEFFAVRKSGSQIFAPKFGWRLFYGAFIACFIVLLMERLPGMRIASNGPPFLFSATFVLLLLFLRPKTLVVDSVGLSSYGLYGFRQNFISWAQVSAVNSDWQEAHFRGWTFMGYRVIVMGMDGISIEHTIFQRQQGKFLDELREHVSRAAFAPGIFDWHP